MIPAPLLQMAEIYAADGRVMPDEAAKLRASLFPDGAVTRAEAEALFVLNDRVADDDLDWRRAFAEAVADHLIDGGEPRGHVTEEGASWLESRIAADGQLKRGTELEVVLKALERAESAPAHLARLARDYVGRAVLAQEDIVGGNRDRVPGQIKACEVALIRRVLHASAASGGVWVTREEAEWLFSLDEATLGYAHDPAWQDVFVKGMLNHLFAPAPDALHDRDASMKRDAWLSEAAPANPGKFWARAFAGGVSGFGKRVRQPGAIDAMADHYAGRVEAAVAAEAFDLAEATYVSVRVRKDGRRSPNEQALLAAIKEAQAA
jgi:hypothetical protein